mgnify:CR=1 FL=1
MVSTMKKEVSCFGKKLGHNFPVAGGKCTQCGIGQDELGSQFQKIEYFVKKPEKGIHTETHALAKEISEFCGEPKKFAMYLGIIKNIGLPRAYRIFAELRQAKEIETPGKLFLFLSSNRPASPAQMSKKPVKKKVKKKKKNKKTKTR